MKQFVKTLNEESACFKYIQKKFPYMIAEKVKEGVYVGSQIKKLTKGVQNREKISTATCFDYFDKKHLTKSNLISILA